MDAPNRWFPAKDVSDPRSFPAIKKYTILLVVSMAGINSPIASTIYLPAIVTMKDYFQTTDTIMNISLSIFTFFTAFFPLIWATFGDRFGARNIYILSFFIYVVGNICCAVSINPAMFIFFRAFSAIGSSSAMSMGAGTISDIFEPHQRGRAFSYYTMGPLLGPTLGPILGGYLNKGLGWRSNLWFLALLGFVSWLGLVFCLPETWRAPVLDSAESDTSTVLDEEKIQVAPVTKNTRMINPIGALKLILYPNIALAVAYIGILFFALYLNNAIFTRTYTYQYGFDSSIVGLCYLPSAFGSILGGVMGGRSSDKLYNKRVSKANGGQTYPEMRLGGFMFYISLVLQLGAFVAYGWSIEKNLHFAYGLVFQFIRKWK
ncbi:major facilitator superfamily domain-containing protein [Pilobolus umbonatus]|nr:major facilitator superfamily domain-containing protein [Pilobolus umbonatus]